MLLLFQNYEQYRCSLSNFKEQKCQTSKIGKQNLTFSVGGREQGVHERELLGGNYYSSTEKLNSAALT